MSHVWVCRLEGKGGLALDLVAQAVFADWFDDKIDPLPEDALQPFREFVHKPEIGKPAVWRAWTEADDDIDIRSVTCRAAGHRTEDRSALDPGRAQLGLVLAQQGYGLFAVHAP